MVSATRIHGRSTNTRHAGVRKQRRLADARAMAEFREKLGIVGRDVQELASTAGDVARRRLNPLEEYVQEKPVTAMLVAAAAGAVFSLLFLRR